MTTPPLICIDPGHGGTDPGAIAGGYREADIALDHALAVAAALERVGCAVLLTRETDRTLDLSARARAANEHGAEIFISMHCNASVNTAASGAWILYRKQSDRAKLLAEAVAEFMDAVIDPDHVGDAVPYPDQSGYTGYTRLAREVIAAKRPGQSDADALREAGVVSPYRSIAVLRETRMPAIMVEAGFITSERDRVRMLDPYHTELMAAAIAAEVSKVLALGVLP